MAYAPRKKKKSLWDNIVDTLGGAADAIVPGDQSNWRSAPTREEQQTRTITRPVDDSPLQVAQARPSSNILNVGKPMSSFDDLEVTTAKPQAIAPVFDEKAVSERLDKGYSWEQIAKETKQDVAKVKEYSQKTRPNYGVAPKDLKEFTDYTMEKTGNKKVFGLDVGQYMGDYGDVNKMTVDQKTQKITEQNFLKGYDSIGRESAKLNTGKQTQDMYTNKLKEMAAAGDERAKFTLDTLVKNGKLKGDWTDVVSSANNEFLGGLPRSGARAIELLPGEQGTGKWAEQDEKKWKGSSDKDKLGETIGSVERTVLDMGLMLTPAGWVDKGVKGTKVVQGITNANRGAGFVARTLPGSAMFTGADIASQASQGNEQNIAKSIALGTAIDLGLPVVGKGISKIPGVDRVPGLVADGTGKLVRKGGEVIEAGKNNVDELLDAARKQFAPPKKGTIKINNPDGAVVGQTKTTDLTPQELPVVSVKRADGRLEQYQPKSAEELATYQKQIDDNRLANGDAAEGIAGKADANGDVWHISSGSQVKKNYAPIEEAPVPAFTAPNKRAIDADGTLERLRQRAANPIAEASPAQANGIKEETYARLVRDYGEEKTANILARTSDATNIRSKDAFVVSEAQKNYGKVKITNQAKQAVPDEAKVLDDFEKLRTEAFDDPEDFLDTPYEQEIIDRASKSGYEVFYDESWNGYMIALKDSGDDIVGASTKLNNLAKKYGFDLEVNADGTIRMYHGTDQAAKEAIVKGGFDDGTTFLTPSKEVEYGGVNGAAYYGDNVVAVDVDPRKVVFNPSGEFSIDSMDNKGAIVRVIDDATVKADVPPTIQEPIPVSQTANSSTPPIREPIQTEAQLGKIAEDFYDSRKGNVKINFNDIKAMADTAAARAYNDFAAIGSDLSRVARITQEAAEKGVKNVDEIAELSDAEKNLWKGVQSELDYMRRRSSLGGKEVSQGDQGSTYFPRMSKDAPPTRDDLFQGFRDKKPGSENARKAQDGLELDEISYSPQVLSKYIIDHSDSKLLQEERIYRNLAKNNPDLPEEQIREAAQAIIDTQNRVNSLTTKVKIYGKKITSNNGVKVDVADDLSKVGQKLGKVQTEVSGTPRGLTNGDRINSVDIDDNGVVRTVGEYTGLNQFRDSSAYAGTHVKAAGGDRNVLAEAVRERLTNGYKIPAEDVEYAVETIQRIKGGLPDNLVIARVEGIYRNAAKAQIMDRLQSLNITNKTLKNDVSKITNQILREGSIQNELSAKIVQKTLRGTNALFRKLNVSSAINELSDLSSFYAVYGKNLKVAQPDFNLVKTMGLGELDPAIDPFIKAIDNGESVKSVLGKINEGTRLYKFVETYKAGVFLRTATDFYSAKGLTGDALTAQVLKDYRDIALPVDAFTKTFLDDFPLFTQYLTWSARNMQKEGRLLTGQVDAGLMKDKSTMERIARDVYANLPAKTVFWLSSNGLKGTTIMTAFGITDFTGMTSQDFSGIAEEDKTFFDRTTQFTNISTIASLLNTSIQTLEKEQLKEKYKDADYNPYENNNVAESFINQYTPQFLKNGMGAQSLQEKGYAESKGGRVQYEAPDDPYNIFKSFVFGKNQTANAREYSGRKNLVDRVNDGKNAVEAVIDIGKEQLGLQETDYNRPLTEDYTEKFKAVSEGERTAILDGGRQYNSLLDDMRKDNPDQYNRYIESMSDHVSPEYWNKNTNGGKDLTLFGMMRDRKRQLQKDLGTAYDPLFDLPDDQAKQVLAYKSATTGTDIALRNTLNKEQWYKDFKDRQGAYFDAKIDEGGEGFKETERMKQWGDLEDKLSGFYYDAEKVATDGVPEWANQFPIVFEQKIVNDKFGFGSPESDAFFKANGDTYKAQKEGYDKAQLEVINQMRAIEGEPPMSWEAYQQATEIADTDTSDDKKGYADSKGGGKSDISPNAGGSYSHTGASGVAKTVKINMKKVALKKRAPAKKIAIKRGGRI